MKYAIELISNEEALDITEDQGFLSKDALEWKYKYQNLRVSAYKRGSICFLTFTQYLKLAKRAGLTRPSQVGKSLEKYQMSRKKDLGDYVWGNCRFLTMSANLHERLVNGGVSETARKLRGRTKETHAYLEKISQNKIGLTKKNDTGRLITSQKLSGRKRPTSDFENTIKSFVLKSPEGKTFRSKNLNDFCRKHGLDQGCMSRTVRGIQGTHKGWSGTYTE